VIVAKVFQLDHPGVRVRKSRIYIGGPYGRCTNIMVSGIRDSWWSRMIGQRVTTLGVHRARGLKVLDDNQGREASHALVFIDPWSDFLFSIDPVVTLAPAIEVLWEDREVKLLLAPVDSEFSVSISGVWSPSIGGMSHTSGPPILCRRVLFYRVGQGGVVYHDRVI
jgi:hypothetical protein